MSPATHEFVRVLERITNGHPARQFVSVHTVDGKSHYGKVKDVAMGTVALVDGNVDDRHEIIIDLEKIVSITAPLKG